MTMERAVRMIARIMVLLSLALAHLFSPWWLALTAFVGLNLLQICLHKLVPGHEHPENPWLEGQCCALEDDDERTRDFTL
jgi:hypothetical protein